jgi:hypothetical protein
MTTKHGKNTTVMLGSVNLSPYLDSMDLSADMDTADTTMFGSTWKSAIPGVLSGKVDFSGAYDPTQAALPTLFLSMLPGVLTYCPGGGAALGDGARLVSALDVSHANSSPVGGLVAIKGSFQATGTVGFGEVLCPLGVVTGTTNGGDQDDLASSSTGWTAHLHVTAVSSGTWTVTIQDAATNDWAALAAPIAFTATTTATSQRLQSATAVVTVRRHVRFVATVAGGSSPTITMFVAFSRNV